MYNILLGWNLYSFIINACK